MKRSRVISIAVLVGIAVMAVTFIGAAKMTGDGSPTSDAKGGQGTERKAGLVVFGNVDTEEGLIPLFPESFPQPTKVIEIVVKEGESVNKAGVDLVRFDPELADINLEEAEAALVRAQASLAKAKAAVEQADQMADAHKFAIDTQEGVLISKKASLRSSEIRLDEQKRKAIALGIKNDAEINAATADLDAAEKLLQSEATKLDGMRKLSPSSKRKEADAAVLEAEAAVKQQSATLRKAKYGRKLMSLTSPCEGKIVRSYCSLGLTFGPHSKQPAILFQPKGPLLIRCEVEQEWASRVELGRSATIHDESDLKKTWRGKITKVGDIFLPKRNQTGDPFAVNDTRVLEVVVEPEKGEDTGLRIGQRVKVTIE